MKNCPICGTEIEEEISSCPICGYTFDGVKAEKVGPRRAKSSKVEPEKPEPKKAEPEKPEPKKAEPEKPEPKEAEPKKAEPEKPEPKEAEPEKPEPKKEEKSKAAVSDRRKPVRQEPVRREVKQEPVRREVKQEPVRREPVRREVKQEPVRREPIRREVKQEPVRREPISQEPEKNPSRIPTPVLGVAAVICVGAIILSTWMLATKTAERKQADETIVIESVHKKEVSETPAATPSATPTPEPTVKVTPTETPTPTPTPEPEIVETITVAGNLEAKVTDFLFPYSSERKITWEEMDAMWGGMNRDDKHYNSQLAIDELLFRHGWTFTSAEPGSERQRMLDKFYATDWYLQAREYYPEGMDIYDYMANYLNGIERENIDLICEWQKANNVYY